MAVVASGSEEYERGKPDGGGDGVSGGSRREPSPSSSGSMGVPVTPHALITNEGPDEWRLLLAGFDTLDLGLYVAWEDQAWIGIIKNLNHHKGLATYSRPSLWKDTEAGPCLVMPGGKGANYKWHIQFPDMHIFIAPFDKPKNLPNVYVSPNAKSLWTRGVDQVVDSITNLIAELGGEVAMVQVSRVDLAADYDLGAGLSLDFLRSHCVSRTRSTQHYEENGQLETFYLGRKKSPIQARFYDKLKLVDKRIESSFFRPIWGPTQNVWRVEFQVRRATLRQFDINSIDDLKAKAGGLWTHLTEQWLSLRIPDNTNTKRRTLDPWWGDVQRLAELFGPSCVLCRTSIDIPKVDAAWYIARIAGCLPSIAARLGISDFEQMLRRVIAEVRLKLAEKHWDEEYCRQRIRMQQLTDIDIDGGLDVPF